MNKYKKRHLIFGIISFCFFVISFVFGTFYFIQGKFFWGFLWAILGECNFYAAYSDIKEYKRR